MGTISYRDYLFNLVAGEEQTASVAGDYWQIIKAEGEISLRFDEQAVALVRSAGMGGPASYNRVTLKSATTQTVRVSLGYTGGAAPYDTRPAQAYGPIEITTDMPAANPTLPDLVVAAGATVEISATDPDRMNTLIQLDEDAVGSVRYGDSNVGPARGPKLYPGDSAVLSGSASVWIHNPQASAVYLHLMLQER